MRRSLRFGHLTIEYDDRVLQPRPWTELQSRWAAELAAQAGPGPLLELCSGAGQIGLLAAALSGRALVAVDADPAACYFIGVNAGGADLNRRTEIREAHLEKAVGPDELFTVALADPPWVRTAEIGSYPEDPETAIDGGADGLGLARACFAACRGHLAPGGSLLLQLGTVDQARHVLEEAGGDGWLEGGRRSGSGGVVQELIHP